MTGPGTARERMAESAMRMLGLDGRRLLLASASPRRRRLLEGLGLAVETRPVRVDEAYPEYLSPVQAAVYLAEKKAAAARAAEDRGEFLILAADTVVVIDGGVLGKPSGPGEAAEMLRKLSGRDHDVITGVAVLCPNRNLVHAGSAATRVRFSALSAADVEALVVSGDWRGKAGAYGIQSLASLVVERLEGDYFNVVGLPLALTRKLILRTVRGDAETPPVFPVRLRRELRGETT